MSDTFGEAAFEELMEEEFFDGELEEPKACPTLYDDVFRLYEGVGDLLNEMSQKPLNLKRIADVSDVVISTSKQIIAGLRKRAYVRAGCSRYDLSKAAKIVHILAGKIPDYPGLRALPPGKAGEWLRRAERAFPQIK
jgi:hypothetical protein